MGDEIIECTKCPYIEWLSEPEDTSDNNRAPIASKVLDLQGVGAKYIKVDGRFKPGFTQKIRLVAAYRREACLARTLYVSRQGRLFQILRLPATVVSVSIFANSVGVLRSPDISVISPQRALVLMYWRVLRTFYFESSSRLRAFGLGPLSLCNVLEAYDKSTALRSRRSENDYASFYREHYSATRRSGLVRFENVCNFVVWISLPSGKLDVLRLERILKVFGDGDNDLYFTVDDPSHYPSLLENCASRARARVVGRTAIYSEICGALAERPNAWWLHIAQATEMSSSASSWLEGFSKRFADSDLVYTDHDFLTEGGVNVNPWFKPGFSYDLLLSYNYIGESFFVKAKVVKCLQNVYARYIIEGISHALLLSAASQPSIQFGHLPVPLFSLKEKASSFLTRSTSIEAVREALIQRKVCGSVSMCDRFLRVRYCIPEPGPLVSIIIPTKDHLDVLRACVDSVLAHTSYANYELIIVDNCSDLPETKCYLDQMSQAGVRVLNYDLPFNYSAINNFAVKHSGGEYLCLLNNDTVVISPDWLSEMLGIAVQAGVGAVGAKLYFPDMTVQHGGDAFGPGDGAHHMHVGLSDEDLGYMGRAAVVNNVSAVTGACLVTSRRLYDEVGGLDERNLKVAFNDVDFCLKLREKGFRIVWTPFAKLFHYESKTRGSDVSPEQKTRSKSEISYMRRRWSALLSEDPFYNPNLSDHLPDFTLAASPRNNDILRSQKVYGLTNFIKKIFRLDS